MSIKVKRGASIERCSAEILSAALLIEPFYAKMGLNLVITSGSEEYKHTAYRSAHYRGDAIDIRIKNVVKADRSKVFKAVKRNLGTDYVVIHENIGKPSEHIHIHWSPVFGGGS